MADARPFTVVDSTGAPLTGGVAGMVLTYVDKTGAAQASPGITELGGGLYQVLPTDADETAGRVAFIDCGAGNEPRRVTIPIHKTDNSNQFWAGHVEDAAGALWAGAAPTFAAYTDKAGAARTAPTLTAIAAAYLWVATPSAADVTADSAGLVLVGGLPWVQLATEPVVTVTVTPVVVGPTIGESLRNALLADVSTSALVATRIYPNELPQGVTMPAIVYSVISDVPETTLNGLVTETLRSARVQVDCYARSSGTGAYAQAHALAEHVASVIGDLSGPTLSANFESSRDLYDNATQYHRVSMDFTVWR